jgi:hypothetical protein
VLRRLLSTEDDEIIQSAIIYLCSRLTEKFAPRIPNSLSNRTGQLANIKFHALYCIVNGLM